MTKPAWSPSPSASLFVMKLAELYARALRVDIERKRQQMQRLADMLNKQDRR